MYRLHRFVQQFDADLLAQRFQRARGCALVQHLRGVGPFLEFFILRDTTLQRDRVVFSPAQAFADEQITRLAVFDDIGGAFEAADLADPRHRRGGLIEIDAGRIVFIWIEARGICGKLWHTFILEIRNYDCPASCAILMITNSAGLSGANATMIFTIPLSMSCCVVVVLSQTTRKAWRGVEPWKAPCVNNPSMKFSIVVRMAVQSGSSFGSKTTHPRLASRVCSKNSAIRRTGT